MLFRLWNVIFLFFMGLCYAEEPSIFKEGADTIVANIFLSSQEVQVLEKPR